MRANKRTDKGVAQYLHMGSWWIWLIVLSSNLSHLLKFRCDDEMLPSFKKIFEKIFWENRNGTFPLPLIAPFAPPFWPETKAARRRKRRKTKESWADLFLMSHVWWSSWESWDSFVRCLDEKEHKRENKRVLPKIFFVVHLHSLISRKWTAP